MPHLVEIERDIIGLMCLPRESLVIVSALRGITTLNCLSPYHGRCAS